MNRYIIKFKETSIMVNNTQTQLEKSRKLKLYINMVLLMLSSTANIVVQTYQNEYEFIVNVDGVDTITKFNHPYF